jgi:hypothetical protein
MNKNKKVMKFQNKRGSKPKKNQRKIKKCVL